MIADLVDREDDIMSIRKIVPTNKDLADIIPYARIVGMGNIIEEWPGAVNSELTFVELETERALST